MVANSVMLYHNVMKLARDLRERIKENNTDQTPQCNKAHSLAIET